MPKRHLATKSKRITCHKRYKILRKVREHHRKVKKEAKKNINRIKHKDPGIPSAHPFKEELFKHVQEIKAYDKEVRLFNLKAAAMPKENFAEERINMSKFQRDCGQVIKESDVILEVLDARDPLGTRCFDIEKEVINLKKKLILVLNKIDLIPWTNLQSWLTYLKREYAVLPFKCNTQQQSKHLSNGRFPIIIDPSDGKKMPSKGSGVDDLMSLLANYCRVGSLQQPGKEGKAGCITVGVIGLPNTGKSALINTLKRQKVCASGNTPGMTRYCQRIRLDKHTYLLDSPGVLASKSSDPYELVLRNCLKPESLSDPVPAIEAILRRCPKQQLMLKYDIDDYADTTTFLVQMAQRLGRMKKGGVPNTTAAARAVITDWISGKITYCTQPPEDSVPIDEIIETESNKLSDTEALSDCSME